MVKDRSLLARLLLALICAGALPKYGSARTFGLNAAETDRKLQEVQGKFMYLGCFKDSRERRLLPVPLGVRRVPRMMLTTCAIIAETFGYAFFGLENGRECWGGNSWPLDATKDGASCDMQCNDIRAPRGEICGGPSSLTAYVFEGPMTSPPPPPPTLPGVPPATPPATPPGEPPATPPGTPPDSPSGTPPDSPAGTPPDSPPAYPPVLPPSTPPGIPPNSPAGTPPNTPPAYPPVLPPSTPPGIPPSSPPSIPPPPPPAAPYCPVACYANTFTVLPIKLWDDPYGNIVAICAVAAKRQGFTHFGVADGSLCLVGNGLSTNSLQAGVCDTPCPLDPSINCGGKTSIYIYTSSECQA